MVSEQLHPDAAVVALAISPVPQPSGFVVMARQPVLDEGNVGNVLYAMDADRFEGTSFDEIEKRIVTVHGSFEFQKCRIKGVVLDETWSSSQARMALIRHHVRTIPVQVSGARSAPPPKEGIETIRKLDLIEITARLLQQNRIRLVETIPHRQELAEQLQHIGYKPEKKLEPVDIEEERPDSEMATAIMLSAWFLEVKSPSTPMGPRRSYVEPTARPFSMGGR